MPQPNDLSRSLVALDQNSTIIAVVELSASPIRRALGKPSSIELELPVEWELYNCEG
jgi:hypothetical protein